MSDPWVGKDCAWCGVPASTLVMTHMPLTRKGRNGKELVVEGGREIPVCEMHYKILVRMPDREVVKKKQKAQRTADKKRQMRIGE